MADKEDRNYKKEAKYHASEKQKKKRAQRNAARAKMIKAGKARVGDGKDIAHSDNDTSNNSPSNLKVQGKSKNRSFARNKNAGRK